MVEGFYKEDKGGWFYAPNYVMSKAYELYKENKDEYEYPVDGWSWYDEAPQEYVDWANIDID